MAAGTNTGMEVPGSNVVMGTEVLVSGAGMGVVVRVSNVVMGTEVRVSNVVMGTEMQVSNVVMGTEVLVSGAGMGVVVPVRVAGTNVSTLSEVDTAIIVDRVTRNLQSPAAGGTPVCPASSEGKLYPKQVVTAVVEEGLSNTHTQISLSWTKWFNSISSQL